MTSQALLKRRAGSTIADFRKYYIERHARLVIPWCLANGVAYYAQIHGPLSWASPAASERYADIDLADWDAIAEMALPDGQIGGVGKVYYENVILPDERVFLYSNALDHLQIVDPGSVVGERVEFIVDGKAVVDGWEEWQGLWEKYAKQE